MSRALVFANGEIEDGPMVQAALDYADDALIIAADGGARIAWHYDQQVDVALGDMDSLSPDEITRLEAKGADIQTFPREKDFTDLELALIFAAERDIHWIRIIGGLGGRLDQTIGNIYLLALPALRNCDVKLVAGKQAAWLLHPGQHVIEGQLDDTLSLIPLDGEVKNIHTDGLYYPLRGESLEFGPARGISNVFTTKTAQISFDAGLLFIVHTVGRA